MLILKNITKREKAQNLIKDIDKFRIWSGKETDIDKFFYKAIENFDKHTFILLNFD